MCYEKRAKEIDAHDSFHGCGVGPFEVGSHRQPGGANHNIKSAEMSRRLFDGGAALGILGDIGADHERLRACFLNDCRHFLQSFSMAGYQGQSGPKICHSNR